MKHLIIFGPPGAGKGTQAEKLSQSLNLIHLSTGQQLRELVINQGISQSEINNIMTAGGLVSDEMVNQMVAQFIVDHPKQIFLLDGYPRNLIQANFLDNLLGAENIMVLNLVVSEKETVNRLASRGRLDDQADNVKRRWLTYCKNTQPLITYYEKNKRLINVDGEGSIEEVFKRLEIDAKQLTDNS